MTKIPSASDIQLFIGDTRIHLLTAPIEQLRQARFASLTFTNQKMEFVEKLLGWHAVVTPTFVRFKPLSAKFSTSVNTRRRALPH